MNFSKLLTLAFIFLLLFSSHSHAQDNTQKPIRLIVPFPPGGVTDVLGRMIGLKLSERLGQQVIVENKPGASGIIGSDLVAKSSPDGLTILLSASSHATFQSLYAKVPFDPTKDFEPISLVATIPYVIVVHPSIAIKSINELIQFAQLNPQKLSYAASAPGQAQHLGGELFKKLSKTDITYIPYKGSSAQMPDLLSGRVPVAIDSLLIMGPHIKSGALNPVALTSLKRSDLLPGVPTVTESGLTNFQAIGWFGLLAHANTPNEIVKKLHDDIQRVMNMPEVRKSMHEKGAEPGNLSSSEFTSFIKQEQSKWTKLIKDANIVIE
jgi:tripartite-type tricarboxylate transporter receptor subunit TctC